jgi:ankyrin repeat protein
MFFADKGDSDMVSFLLERKNKANTKLKDINGFTSDMYAARNGYNQIAELIRNHLR